MARAAAAGGSVDPVRAGVFTAAAAAELNPTSWLGVALGSGGGTGFEGPVSSSLTSVSVMVRSRPSRTWP